MNELFTVEQMYEADRLTMASYVSGQELMENAGKGCAETIVDRWPAGRVVILCGPGNNGGDGFVIARHLQLAGWNVTLGLLGDVSTLSGDAKFMAALWDGEIKGLSPDLLQTADVVVDAIFGAGLSRPIDGIVLETLQAAERSGAAVIAVDVPSGVDGDSGQIHGYALPAELTLTFCRKKLGHVLLPGRVTCGETHVIDIGIPDHVVDQIMSNVWENDPELWHELIPTPQLSDHKYSRGHTLVVSGGTETSAAARLSAMGALRIGSGLVTVACPAEALQVNASQLLSIMVRSFTDFAALQELVSDRRKNAIVIGPGAGVGADTISYVVHFLSLRRSTVLDADALTSFQDDPQRLFLSLHEQVVLTPHAGEFDRLWPDLLNAKGSKVTAARQAAQLCGSAIVLKGADTVIAGPDGRTVVNTHAPPWLATAGSGDVLAGFIAGLMAQGMPAFEASCAGVWFHGACGNRLGRGLIAEDLPHAVPNVLQNMMQDCG